jgi:ubiquinone biosynthesis monooxygenase Coq7
MLRLDRVIVEFDRALRAMAGQPHGQRRSPADAVSEAPLEDRERRHSAALMRVNHCGEVCAQALYQGQSLASQNDALRTALAQAAREESDHLAWTRERIRELGGRTSLLNPLWYAGSFAIGYTAGKLGDAWNLGFLAETEVQVARHLEGHLEQLSPRDERTRAVVDAMRADESGHARTARELGARQLPEGVRQAMRYASRLMTTTSYWV